MLDNTATASSLSAPEDYGLWFLNSHVTIQLAQAENAGGISVLLLRMARDDAPPLHIHHEEDEIFHITEGEIRFLVGGQVVIGRAGQTVLGPRGVPHGFRVLSEEARMLVIQQGGFEGLVRAFSRPAESPLPPAFMVPTPEMQAALAEACAAQRIELLGPPID